MALRTSHHERALAAAAGLVGRPRLRFGLMLTLVAACGSGPNEGETEAPGEGSTGSTAAEATTLATTSGGADETGGATGTGEALTTGTTSTGTTSTGEASTSTTGEATLLTDATTLASTTSSTTSGDTETGETTDGEPGTDTGSSSGGLDDCVDTRTGEIDWVCCERQMWEPQPQCTPWGPPAPPAALHERLRRARAARGRWV